MDEARRSFDRALELNPSLLEAIRGAIAVDISGKKIAHARATIQQQLAKAPKDADVLALAASAYSAIGDLASEEAMHRRLLEVAPDTFQAYIGLARLFMRQRKLDAAKAEFEQLAARQPKSVVAPTMIAVILEAQGKLADAEKMYERALAIDPLAPLPANNLASIYATAAATSMPRSLSRRPPNRSSARWPK